MLCVNCGQELSAEARLCNICGAAFVGTPIEIPSADIGTSSDFVGRRREMGELVAALDDAASGNGRLVMPVGEPGIGKTRTAEESCGPCP